MTKNSTKNKNDSDASKAFEVKKERQESATAQSKIDDMREKTSKTRKSKNKKNFSSNLQAANIVGLHSYHARECRRSQRVSRHLS